MSKNGNVIDLLMSSKGLHSRGLHETLAKGNLAPAEMQKAKEGQIKDFPNGISECGTDALRFALCAYCQQGKDINLDIKRVESYRNFCNKLWNATKLAWMFLGDNYTPSPTTETEPTGNESLMDKWILHRLNVAIEAANKGFEDFEFGIATTVIYDFWLYETCDVYLECIKPIMNPKDSKVDPVAQEAVRATLYTCLDEGYRLLSPFMPFITEELWQRLPRRAGDLTESIAVAAYPTPLAARANPELCAEVEYVQKLVKVTRSMQNMYNIVKSAKPSVTVNMHDEAAKERLLRYEGVFVALSYAGKLTVTVNEEPPRGCAADIPDRSCEIYLHIKGLVDIDQELSKLNTKYNNAHSLRQTLLQRMDSSDYTKVPDHIKERDNEKLEHLTVELENVQKAMKTFNNIKEQDST